jgi:hypothetical protein
LLSPASSAIAGPNVSVLMNGTGRNSPLGLSSFLVVWLGFAGAGLCLRKLGRASLAPALHALFWIGVYAVYWARVK